MLGIPVDESTFEKNFTPNQEVIDIDHEAALYARYPSKALEVVAEDSEGHFDIGDYAFSARDIQEYICKISGRARGITTSRQPEGRDEIAVEEDLAEYGEFDHGYDAVRHKLENAARSEQYGQAIVDGDKYFAVREG